MENETTCGAGSEAMHTDLIDLDGLVLADVDALTKPVLLRALRRVLADPGGLDEPIAAFQSSI